MKNKLVHYFIISIFCSLYFLIATISMINSVAFFDLTHEGIMNWALAIGFELGAAASLAAIIILDKTNKAMVWFLFLLLTAFQMMANSFHAFINLENYMSWIELFGLQEEEPIFQKRILSIVSGAVLPLVALGFIKSLVDYIRPTEEITISSENQTEEITIPSENQTEEINDQPLEQLEEVKNESSNKIVESDANVQSTADKVVDNKPRVMPRKYLRAKLKKNNDHSTVEPIKTERKYYVPKP